MINWVALSVFIFFFLLVTVLGFIAARWRRGDLSQLNEWGLAGRRFGTTVTWFLLGGDLYTAYTFVAVPGLMFFHHAGCRLVDGRPFVTAAREAHLGSGRRPCGWCEP